MVVKVLQSGVGDVTQSDVSLASVSKATIIAFNVAADNPVRGSHMFNVVFMIRGLCFLQRHTSFL